MCLVHQKKKLATIGINKFLIQVCLNFCIQSFLWLPNLNFTKISSSLTQRKLTHENKRPLLPLQPRVLKYSVPTKKHWVNPDCQNSEPMKRTVSISALVLAKTAHSAQTHKSISLFELFGALYMYISAKGSFNNYADRILPI